MKHFFSTIYFSVISSIVIVVLFNGCAQMAVPTGGAKDVQAPELKTNSCLPKNFSTNFKENKIELVFDEYIRLTNPQQQILISPALTKTPVYLVKGKTLKILLPDSLQTNTTYTINFGNSISDITEGNIAKNLQYVFSTGNFIDSLSVRGRVINALTGKAEKGIRVMLNSDLSSDAALRLKPDYISISDEQGNFSFKYIKSGKFQLYGINDIDANYLFNPDAEAVAFNLEALELNSSYTNEPLDLLLFKEEAITYYIKKRQLVHPGKMLYVFNEKIPENKKTRISESINPKSIFHYWKADDSLEVFYSIQHEGEIYLSYTEQMADTFFYSIKEKEQARFLSEFLQLKLNTVPFADINGSFFIQSHVPIRHFYPEKIKITRDSILINPSLKQTNPYRITADLSFLNDYKNNYTVILEKGALKSILDISNQQDTFRFVSRKPDYYGTLLLEIQNVKSNYILQLLNDRGHLIYQSSPGLLKSISKIEYLVPGTYKLRILIDEDANNTWTTGKYTDRKLPETIINYEGAIQIRSNWDVEIKWLIK